MAGFKFGKMFDDFFGQGFKKVAKSINKQFENNIDLEGLKNAADYLSDISKSALELNQRADKVGQELIFLAKQMDIAKKRGENLSALKAREIQLLEESLIIDQAAYAEKIRLKEAEEDYKEAQKELAKNLTENKSKWDKFADGFSDASSKFDQEIKKLSEDLGKGEIDISEFNDKVAGLETSKISDQMEGLFGGGMSGALDKGKGMLKEGMGKVLDGALSALGPMGKIISVVLVEGIMEAFNQIMELNTALINLQRATGGMATAARLGFDEFGNSKSTMQSLATQAAKANISVEQFSGSLQDLFSGALKGGQIAGLKDDLAKSADGLRTYAIEAARIEKLYGAKIGPAVSNLMSNFGMGVKDATKLVKDGADTAKQLGLNVQAFTENLTQATDLAGEFYFKTADQVTKLAGLATQLGTSVNAIAGGVVKMNGITELFNKQQQSAALGLSTFSKNLSKAYALQAQGKGADAAKVQLQSLAKDLTRNGLTDKEGQVTQQGIATATAAGASQEQIQALQKMARNATKAGLALDQAFDPASLTQAQKRRLEAAEAENTTIQEAFGNMWGELKGAFLDPLAQILGPAIKNLAGVLQPLVGIITGVVGIFKDLGLVVLAPFMEVSNQLNKTSQDIIKPIKNAVDTLRTALTPVMNALKGFAVFVAKFIMMPFRIVGRIIGGIIDVVARVIKVIGEKLAPIFEWVSDLFGEGGGALDSFLDTITDMFGWLADLVGGALGIAFDILGGIIKGVVGAFKWLWDGLKMLWSVIDEYLITPISDMLAPVFETLGEVLDALLAPFQWLWEQLKAFGDWLAKWFGDSEDSGGTSDLTPEDWKKVLGTEDAANPKGPDTTAPSAQGVADAQQAVYAKGDELQAKNEAAINSTFGGGGTSGGGSKSTTIINVDPTFGNKQTIKEG